MARKKTTRLSQKQLDYYKALLTEKMKEILGDVCSIEKTIFQGSGELSTMPVHLADKGTDNYEQEFSLDLMAEERKNLVEIQQALARIQNGTFGICEGLGTPIEENRLVAIPWTRYSLEYAQMIESGKVMKIDNFRRRPIDILRQADEEYEEEEDNKTLDAEDVGLLDNDMGNSKGSDSLDQLQQEEDYDKDEDIERQRSA